MSEKPPRTCGNPFYLHHPEALRCELPAGHKGACEGLERGPGFAIHTRWGPDDTSLPVLRTAL